MTCLCVWNVLLLKCILNCPWFNTNMKCVLNDSVLLILHHPTCPAPSLPSHATLYHLLYKSSTGKVIWVNFTHLFSSVNAVDSYHLWSLAYCLVDYFYCHIRFRVCQQHPKVKLSRSILMFSWCLVRGVHWQWSISRETKQWRGN